MAKKEKAPTAATATMINASLGVVVWTDAVSHGNNSYHLMEYPHKSLVVFTPGFIMKSDKSGVSLAGEINEQGNVRDLVFIPRGMVVEERVLVKNAVVAELGGLSVSFEKGKR